MYTFWEYWKRNLKCNKKPYSKLLENKLLKDDYERYKKNKDNKLSQEDKVNELLEFIKDRDTLITNKENLKFTDGMSMYGFWTNCKTDLKCEKESHSNLLENKLLKDDYERYKKDKEKYL